MTVVQETPAKSRRAPPPPNPFAPKGNAPAASTAASPLPSGRMSVVGLKAELKTGLPWAIVVYAEKGLGKTTLGANSPSPIILAAEAHGADELVVPSRAPANWAEVFELLDSLKNDEHAFKTLIVDTADWLESIIWRELCRRDGVATIELACKGYGKAYSAAVDLLVEFQSRVEEIQAKRGMNCLILAHCQIKKEKNPIEGDYDHYCLKLHDKFAAKLSEWAKAVLFGRADVVTHQGSDGHTRGTTSGERTLSTRWTPGADAKNRLWLPPSMRFSWAVLEEEIAKGEALRVAYYTAIGAVDDATRRNAQKYVESVNYDPIQIQAVIDQLTAPEPQKEETK